MNERKPLALSEAIRLGSSVTEPTVPGELQFFDNSLSDKETICYACAIGAVHVALCGLSFTEYPAETKMIRAFPIMEKIVECPGAPCAYPPNMHLELPKYALGNVISHLFESHKWDRLRIADWVETIEQTVPAPIATTDHTTPAAPLYIDGEVDPSEDYADLVRDLLEEDRLFQESEAALNG